MASQRKFPSIYDVEIPDMMSKFVFIEKELYDLSDNNLKEVKKLYETQTDWTDENLKAQAMALSEKLACKSGQIFLPLRLALTGVATTPGGATEMAELLGKEESMRRLDYSIALLEKALS